MDVKIYARFFSQKYWKNKEFQASFDLPDKSQVLLPFILEKNLKKYEP